MKQIVSIFFLISFGVQAQTAVEYLDKINTYWEPVTQETWAYLKATSHGNAKKQDKRRQDLIEATKKAKYSASQTGAYKGDDSYVTSVSNYLDLSLASMQRDYQKIVDMEEIAMNSYDKMELYLATKEAVNQKLDSAGEVLQYAQKEFAQKNSITLISKDSKVETKIKTASKALEYYDKIYLIFFKSYLQENNLLEAQKAESIGGMEQSRQALEDFSKEGMEKLYTIPSYNSDSRLKSACYNMLEFYYGEAKRYAPQQIDFYISKDDFDKAKSKMESKSKPTQAEVNEYNIAVKSMNTKSQEFNKTNAYLNEFRGKRLDMLNQEIENFFSTHMR